jgi:hypothetical protein
VYVCFNLDVQVTSCDEHIVETSSRELLANLFD